MSFLSESEGSFTRNDAVAELYSGEFNVACCRDPEYKLPTPPPHKTKMHIFY
jgi:hypothetical protein